MENKHDLLRFADYVKAINNTDQCHLVAANVATQSIDGAFQLLGVGGYLGLPLVFADVFRDPSVWTECHDEEAVRTLNGIPVYRLSDRCIEMLATLRAVAADTDAFVIAGHVDSPSNQLPVSALNDTGPSPIPILNRESKATL